MPDLILSEFAQKGEEIYKTHILSEILELLKAESAPVAEPAEAFHERWEKELLVTSALDWG